MSNSDLDAQNDTGYSSDEGPPELTWEEIQNSVYEFDPVFEFDAPQWFDFSDRKAMYAYDQDTRNGIRDGQAEEEDWFAVLHEGHDPEYYEFGAYSNEDFAEDIDIGFGSAAAGLDSLTMTPKKPLGAPKRVARMSPTQSSPQEPCTPSHPRKKALTSALSPTALASKVSSPMRGGALRVPISSQTTSTKTSTQSPDEAPSSKRTGPQRLLVLESPPPVAKSPPSSLNSSKSTSPNSISPKTQQLRYQKPSSRSPTKISKPTPTPRYHEPSKPAHVSQCPPRSMAQLSSNSMRVGAANITKRQQPLATKNPPSSQSTKATSPHATATSRSTVIHSPPVPSAENTLLSKVDAVLNSAKHVKQVPAYEPRRFGIKDIKAWEQRSGRRWYELDVEERQIANQEMDDWRRLQAAAT